MNIGIITFHRADNFGAALQCFALQFFLQQQGHKVKVLDYRCKAIEQVYYLFDIRLLFARKNIFKTLNTYLFNILNYGEMYRKRSAYKRFRSEFLSLSKPLRSEFKEECGIDAYIAGSDQIWNFSLLHGYNKMYFLDFPTVSQSLKISYAASSESSAFPELERFKKNISLALNRFDSISVRETELKEELQKYTSKEISVCIDPTFLLEKNEYEKILVTPKERGYILVYHMAETLDAVDLANHIAKEKGLDVIEIHASFKSKKGLRHKRDLGPLQILGYIKYADAVITNSFHGVSLSLILNKELWVINKYKSARLQTLLSISGLTNRYIKNIGEYHNSTIDYTLVKSNMEKIIQDSQKFLIQSLSNRKK